MSLWTQRPGPDEFGAYYAGYVARVPAGDLIDVLTSPLEDDAGILARLRAAPAATAGRRYAEGKWSVAEVMGHVVDTERVFATRAMRFARGDTTPLPGMDQDVLIQGAAFDARPLGSLLTEFEHLRRSNVVLFASLEAPVHDRRGVASDVSFSVRALATILAGHALHHMDVLAERYLA